MIFYELLGRVLKLSFGPFVVFQEDVQGSLRGASYNNQAQRGQRRTQVFLQNQLKEDPEYVQVYSLYSYATPDQFVIVTLMVCFECNVARNLQLLTYALTARVVRAPQLISQPVSSILLCTPLPSGTRQTPGLQLERLNIKPSFQLQNGMFFCVLTLKI